MRIKKNNTQGIGYYDKEDNIYYLYDNSLIEFIRQLYPNASIQLSLFS